MEFYLYPPKYISSAAIATLAPPVDRRAWEADIYRTSNPELAGEKQALNYVRAFRDAVEGKLPLATPASAGAARLQYLRRPVLPIWEQAGHMSP
jgi:hypothetical protein